ncbi:hypothetical protein [Paractinoplanes rishiriensis]|uniref:hypothetical protein n=1 Tax=Paractinoplanes rishiriensis TaxID=1050105 RepID=UPI001940F632|nr:hypothetical protein [Actinoplanes rishiriensis]
MFVTRKSIIAALAAVCSAALILVAPAAPARAESVQTFQNAYLRRGFMLSCCDSNAAAPAWLEQFGNAAWTVYSVGSVNGHGIVRLQSADRPAAGCLDSHGNNAGGSVWVQACNSGDYQKWEVFNVSSGGESFVVFKSRGAYTQQGGRHLCVAGKLVTNGVREGIHLATCNTGDSWQRFF